MTKELIYSGSVKEIYEDKDNSHLFFNFSDRYSVFDWGEMPDKLDGKGKALSIMGAFFFEFLSSKKNWEQASFPDYLANTRSYQNILDNGFKSHFIGLTSGFELEVKKVAILKPEFEIKENKKKWNYFYTPETKEALVPLEVIFRFGMPPGSSLKKRVNSKEYLKSLGLNDIPVEGEFFSKPVVEFSTKLEPEDRYLNYLEAKKMAALTDMEFQNLIDTTKVIAYRLKLLFEQMDIELWDGKFEFAFNESREFILVDSIGLDELRLLYKGKHLSKEFLRQFYRKTPWYEATEVAKTKAQEDATINWKEYCVKELSQKPEHLPAKLRSKAESLYKYLTNEFLFLSGRDKVFAQEETLRNFLDNF